MSLVASSGAAADVAPQTREAGVGAIEDAGPVGDFHWQGLNWERRFWGGGPHYNGQFDPANVVGPDASGAVTLKLTNPTGRAPIAAEFRTTRRGFGYGTYSVVVDKRLDTMQPEVVWGCLFTYDHESPPGHNEIDLCEASAWGGGGAERWPVSQAHGYWFDATKPPGEGNAVEVFDVSSVRVQTHRMVWKPGMLTYETYAGEGFDGPMTKQTLLRGPTVPVPAGEAIHFNLWVVGGNGGDPDRVAEEHVVVRDLSFVPADAGLDPGPEPGPTGPAPAPGPETPEPGSAGSPIELTATGSKTKGMNAASLRWSGANGASVRILIDGEATSAGNTGEYEHATRSRGNPTFTYQVCDAGGCSQQVDVSRWG